MPSTITLFRRKILCQLLIDFQSGGASEGAINIYTQLNEPDKKEGIWVQTNNQYNKIITDDNIFRSDGVWDINIQYPFVWQNGVEMNGLMYIITANNRNYYTMQYAYGKNNEWTTGKFNIPSSAFDGHNAHLYYNSVVSIPVCAFYDDKIYIYSTISFTNNEDNNSETYYAIITIDSSNNIMYKVMHGGILAYHMVIFNNAFYFCKYDNDMSTYLYKYDITDNKFINKGMIWNSSVYTMTVCNGLIYFAGADYSRINNYLYSYNGYSFTQHSRAPYRLDGSCGISYNGFVYVFGGFWNQKDYSRYNPIDNTWTTMGTMPIKIENNSCSAAYSPMLYNNGIYFKNNQMFKASEKIYDPNTLILQRGETGAGKYITAFSNLTESVTSSNNKNRFVSGFDDVFYFTDIAFDWNAPMYYGNGSQWIKFKN